MKRFIYTMIFAIMLTTVNAQTNVGINTTNPQASLDVRGSERVGGATNYTKYDSATGRIEWVGAALFAPASQQIIRHSASSEGLYAGGGRLEYRNTTVPVFFTDWTTGNGYFRSRLGINNLTPQFPLSMDGALGDKISLWTDGTPTHYGFGIQSSLLQIFSKTNLDDIAFGYGSSTAFTERMRVKGNGNVGIGTSTPNAPLGFPPSIGKKITLYPGATGDVGMAVQGNLLQIYADHPNADIAFGYDQAGTMTERMRIKGNGNVGIGNNNPGYYLDVNGRMRIRSGGNNSVSSGIWFNNNSNVEAAFVGMEDDTHVGLFGNNGAGWKLAMNTQTGALQVNGQDGSAGQVLQSSGSGGSPTWTSSTNALYNNTITITNSATQVLNTAAGWVPLTGMSYSFSVTGNAKVLFSYSIPASPGSCVACGESEAYIDLFVDGSASNRTWNSIANGAGATLSLTKVLTVGPGSHTISLSAQAIGNNVNIAPCCAFEKVMTVQVIPQ
jgi:hypothetical protein